MTERKETTTFGLGSDKVARFLRIGSKDNEADSKQAEDELKGELLRDRLAETLALYDAKTGEVSRSQTKMSQVIGDLAGEPIGMLLRARKTDLSILRRIKDHGRKLSESAKSKPERHVANTIYYAAIAAAFLFHDTQITSHSYADLGRSLRRLVKEIWIPESLTSLFGKAVIIIKERHKS